MTKKLRAFYIRQLRKSGWEGKLGGWVYNPKGARIAQGWDHVIRELARSFGRWGAQPVQGLMFCGHMECLASSRCLRAFGGR